MNETNENENLVSAQVVLKETSAKESPDVTVEFKRDGFIVGNLYANSFAITASIRKFETYFQISLQTSPDGGVQIATEHKTDIYNLPINALTATIRNQVKTIVFTKPPDFGQGSSY